MITKLIEKTIRLDENWRAKVVLQRMGGNQNCPGVYVTIISRFNAWDDTEDRMQDVFTEAVWFPGDDDDFDRIKAAIAIVEKIEREKCSSCNGDGWTYEPDGQKVTCLTCNGTGKAVTAC